MTLAGIHHSTGKDNWATPPEFFSRVAERFSFVLDAAAEPWSAKTERYYTEEQDGLVQPWTSWTWCNPPYSSILPWVKKAVLEMENGNSSVLLTFARTDTAAFHEYAMRASKIIFVRGRLCFVSPDTRAKTNSAPSPSMLLVFDASNKKNANPVIETMDSKVR